MSDQTDTAGQLVWGTKMLQMIQWVMVNIFAGVADTTTPSADIRAGLGQQRQENKAEFLDQYSTLSSGDEIVGSQSADSSEIKSSPQRHHSHRSKFSSWNFGGQRFKFV